jgi:hypothetical protein
MAELSALRKSIAALFGVAIDPTNGLVTQGIEARPEDHALRAWSTYMALVPNSSTLAAAGTLAGVRVRRVPVGLLTGLVVTITSAGSSLTAGQCFAAVWNASTKARLAVTADQSTAWASPGVKVMPFAGGPVSWAGGDLDIGAWYQGSSAPSVARSGVNPSHNNVNLSAPNLAVWSANTGLTTTAPSTLGTQTENGNSFWVGVY